MSIVPGNSDRGRVLNALAILLGHANRYILAGFGVIFVTAVLVDNPAANYVVAAAFVLLLLGMAGGIRHAFLLCPICADRTPLDPAAAVERADRLLRIAHLPRWLNWVPVAPLLLVGHWPVAYAALLAIAYAGWTVNEWAMWRHAQLRPWCPHCRKGWDEDDAPEEPSPTPDPSMTKERVS